MTEALSEAARLSAYVRLSRGHFSLTLARYVDERIARPLWERLLASLRDEGCMIALVDLSGAPPDTPILARLQRTALGADGLFVVGLEQLLLGSDEQPLATRAVATFNFNRDLLRSRVPVPVVLWLSDAATGALAQLAPDTFDVLRTTFDFPEIGPEHEAAAQPRVPQWLRPAPAAEHAALERRAAALASLLDGADPESAEAGDLAASLAMTLFALDRGEAGDATLERAHRAYEGADNLGAAATALRQRAQWSIVRGDLEQAERTLQQAQVLAQRAIGSDSPLKLLAKRADIIEARTALAAARAQSGTRDSDAELLERWRGGDKAAGNELFDRYYEPVRRFVEMRAPKDDAHDLAQEVFIRILERRDKLGPHFRSYLFGVARDILIYYNTRRRHSKVRQSWTDSALRPTIHVHSLNEGRWIEQLLEHLPQAEREVIELRYLEDLSIGEIASVFGVAPATIRFRLARARRRMEQYRDLPPPPIK